MLVFILISLCKLMVPVHFGLSFKGVGSKPVHFFKQFIQLFKLFLGVIIPPVITL